VVINCKLTIADARGRIRREVTSPFNRATMVSQQRSVNILCLSCVNRKLYAFFSIVLEDGLLILVARERSRYEVASQFDRAT
jgi:hypothetical protein